MSKVLLQIGYLTLLLPDDKGVQGVLKALSRAVPCHDYSSYRGEIELDDEETQQRFAVGLTYVGNGVRIVGKNVKEPPLRTLPGPRPSGRRGQLLLAQERDE